MQGGERMYQENAVQKMQEYIEKNIENTITLSQLAKAAGYSQWHAARLFKEMTGKTPFAYIRALRLTKAALILRDGKRKVTDVALDFVFDSQEGFTRAFTKEFGLPPGKYSKQTPAIKLFIPDKVIDLSEIYNKRKKADKMGNTKAVFVQIVNRPERKLLLKRGIKAEDYFEYCEEVGCDVWSTLTSVKEALYEPVGLWLPDHLIKSNTSKYVQGVELPLDYTKEIPEDYELITLPPCTMMVFQGEPYNDDDFMDEISEVWEHIDKFNPEIYGYSWAYDKAPSFQLAPMGYRGYIEARPVEKLN